MRLVPVRLLPVVGLSRHGYRAPAADPPTFTPEQVAFYEKEVPPVLKEHCLKCHGDDEKIKGGLDLTTPQGRARRRRHRPGRGPRRSPPTACS